MTPEQIEHIYQRELSELPLFDGDAPSTHDVMRWASKRSIADKENQAKTNYMKKRHFLFVQLYKDKLESLFKLSVDATSRCYVFENYKFYPETNKIEIDGKIYSRGFGFIDRICNKY